MIKPPLPALFALPLWNMFGNFGPVPRAVLMDESFDELILFFSPWFFVGFGFRVVGFVEDFRGEWDIAPLLKGSTEIHVSKVTVIINLMS